jgi:hypothetical protein
MIEPKEYKDLESLMKVNKHLGIALSELTDTHSYVGVLTEQRRLIKIKLRLESIMERTLKAEMLSKDKVFRKLK